MRYSIFLFALVVTCCSELTQARSLRASSDMMTHYTDRSLNFTSDSTTSLRDMKVVLAARDDAAGFVASQGQIRAARLEAAFVVLREQLPEARTASDLALAEAILAL